MTEAELKEVRSKIESEIKKTEKIISDYKELIKPVSPSLLSDAIMGALGKKTHLRYFQQHKEQLPCVAKIQGVKLLVAEDNEMN